MGDVVLSPDLDAVRVKVRLNPRQERFCQAIMRGSSVLGAYREAYADLDQGGNPDRDQEHARRIHGHPGVQQRLRDLAEAAEVTAEWVVRQAKRIVEGADSETAQVQALTLLARLYPATFAGGGAGGTRVNVMAAPGSSVNVTTSLGAGLDSAEAREIAEAALRSLLAAPAAGPVGGPVVDAQVLDVGVTP